MHKMLVLYPKGQDEKKFRAHYESKHLPLAVRLPGLIGWRYSFDIEGTRGAESPYYCIFEADFADVAAMGKAMQSPEGQAVAGDVSNYVTVPPIIVHYEVEG
jgi:uncharacterized protein (TIGR02118 family)